MDQSGEAADQVLRISLDGVQYTLKIAGSAAERIAAFILAALKSDGTEKTTNISLTGKETLKKFLKSGKQTTVFTIAESDLQTFKDEAKRYGVSYCVLKNTDKNTQTVEIMTKEEDAPAVNRIVEKLQFATVDKTTVLPDKPLTPRQQRREERRENRETRTSARKARREASAGASKAYSGEVKAARKAANKQFGRDRKAAATGRKQANRAAYEQYRADIGKPIKAKPQKERSETAQLLIALFASLWNSLPFIRNRNHEENDHVQSNDAPQPPPQAAPATPPSAEAALPRDNTPETATQEAPDKPPQVSPQMDSPQQQEGGPQTGPPHASQAPPVQKPPPPQAAPKPAPAPASPLAPLPNPTQRTDGPNPSAPGSGNELRPARGAITADEPLSVKRFVTDPLYRQERRRDAERIREARTGQPPRRHAPQHMQPRTKGPRGRSKKKVRG